MFGERPTGADVTAGAGRGDAHFLAGEFSDALDGRIGFYHQVPAVVAVGPIGDAAHVHTLQEAARNRRGGVEDEVGGARGNGLETFRTAAIDRQLDLDAFLFEKLLSERGLAHDGGPIGLGGHADADTGAGLSESAAWCQNGGGTANQQRPPQLVRPLTHFAHYRPPMTFRQWHARVPRRSLPAAVVPDAVLREQCS